MLGFIGAPLAPQIMLAWASITKGPAGIWVIWTLVASYFLILTSGVATHLILSRRGRYSPSSYMFTGGAIGVIAGMLGAVIVRLLSLGRPDTSAIELPVAFGILGGVLMVFISAFFWIIARPDRL